MAALVLCSTGIASADSNSRDGLPTNAIQPIYPAYCLIKQLQGHVDFIFTVDGKGKVKDAVVIDAVVYQVAATSPIDDDRAKKAFISAAETSISQFRYKPLIENGHAVERKGMKTRISFALED